MYNVHKRQNFGLKITYQDVEKQKVDSKDKLIWFENLYVEWVS